MSDIADRVRQTVFDHLGKARALTPSRVIPAAHFVEDLGADSLDIVEIILCLEDQFGREISENEAANVETVGDVIALVEPEH